jgi:peptidyl-prolyl cis-trans isomerase SurA
MQLRTNNLKFSINQKILSICLLLLVSTSIDAQEIIEEEAKVEPKEKPSLNPGDRVKVDGVAAVVGDFVVLDSDIDKQYALLQASGVSIQDVTDCQLFGKLLEDKLLMHHAIQDSIVVNDAEIQSYVDQQLFALQQQKGNLDELLQFYNKDTEQELRDEMYTLNKNNRLAAMMQQRVVEEIEITPEEVRQFFNSIPKDELPQFGTELKVGQIVVIPETSDDENQKVIDKLNTFRSDVIDNGASFTSKVVLYSDDLASRKDGGKYTLNRQRPQMVKEFREVAFSLQEGEISEPFESIFGYHIIFLEKIRGQEYDVRHILLRPEVTTTAINDAMEKIETARDRIANGEITFADAAKEVSDEKETKFEGGLLINPQTQDYSFELTKMDPELYAQIQNLDEGSVSRVYKDESDRLNPIKFKILSVFDRTDEHQADYSKDYLKIKALALQEKRIKVIEKWQAQKISETFIKVNGIHRDCDFNSNWLKK